MTTLQPCPNCGEYDLHHSRSRNMKEKMIKTFFHYRVYRCHTCQWRGWMRKKPLNDKKHVLKNMAFYLVVVIAALIVALLLKNVAY